MCSNGFILNRVVRETWGWKGFVVSDCDALNTMMVRGEPGGNTNFGHAYSLHGAMAAQDGTRAGCDSGCSQVYKGFGMQAVAEGLITEKEVNASVRRLLRPHFELGLFDPIEGQPYVHLGWEHVATPEHQQLALEAARQSIVLLQNPGGVSPVLPLKPGSTMLVAGPLYDATTVMLGNYNGKAAPMQPLWSHIASVNGAASLTNKSGAVGDACNNSTGISAVVAAAKGKEVVVLALGGSCHEGEGTDRDFLGFLALSMFELSRCMPSLG